MALGPPRLRAVSPLWRKRIGAEPVRKRDMRARIIELQLAAHRPPDLDTVVVCWSERTVTRDGRVYHVPPESDCFAFPVPALWQSMPSRQRMKMP